MYYHQITSPHHALNTTSLRAEVVKLTTASLPKRIKKERNKKEATTAPRVKAPPSFAHNEQSGA
jgi:hypothetical protein